MSKVPPLAGRVLIGMLWVNVMAASLSAAERDVQIRSFDFTTGVLELFNFGAADQPLDGWRFCSHNGSSVRDYSSFAALNGVTIEASTSLFVHFNNDSPGGPDNFDRSQLGPFATVASDAYAISIYFAPVSFPLGSTMGDHLQWSLGGADNSTADERTGVARSGGLWPDENAWIPVTEVTERIVLTDETGGLAHGPENYDVIEGKVVEPPAERFVQLRSIDLEAGQIELHNFSSMDMSLDGWQFCSHDQSASRVYSSEGGLNGIVLAAGASLVIHLNNDAPGATGAVNASAVGPFAELDSGPNGLGLYFPPVDFERPDSIADYLQWSVDGVADAVADERADEAESGGVWQDQTQWISTTPETTRVELTEGAPSIAHGPGDYVVTNAEPPLPKRAVQIREVNIAQGVVEFFNFSDVDVPLDGWSICTHNEAEARFYTDETALNGVTLEAGTSIFVHYGDDAPVNDADRFNASSLGAIAPGLDTGPYSIDFYFPSDEGFIDFELAELLADHLQWSVGGADDEVADERADEAVLAGLWIDENAWIATTAETNSIRLSDDSGGLLHGPENYAVSGGGGGTQFHRGDTNDDGGLDLTDGVRIFNFLFLGGEAPTCREAADANNSGDVDLTDGVSILNFLFQGGPAPAAPGPTNQACGLDPDAAGSPGDLGCESYNNC